MNKKNAEIERFLEFEDKYGFTFSIENVQIWKYIREYVYDSYINSFFETEDRVVGFKKWKFRLYLFSQLYKIVVPDNKLKEKDIIILSFPRQMKVENKYVCIQFDALMNVLDNNYVLIENPFWLEDQSYLTSHFSKRDHNYVYTDKNELLFRLRFPIWRMRWMRGFEKRYKLIIYNWCEVINKKLGLNIEKRKLFDQVFYYLCFEKYAIKYYLELLKKINPKCILEVYTPNHQIALLNTIAHRLKIPVVDIQHGAIGKYEPIMHTYARKHVYEHLYDYIFMFGKYWCEKNNSHLEQDHMIPVGVPFLEQQKERIKNSQLIKDTILIVSQTRYSDLFYDIAKLIRAEKGLSKYKIVLKLHPYENAKYRLGKYRKLVDCGVEVICGQEFPVYDLYEKAYCVIGINSTCLYEALFLDIPIYFFEDKYGVNDLIELSKKFSLINPFKDVKTLISLLLRKQNNRDELLNPVEELFSDNSLDNILSNLNVIIGKQEWMRNVMADLYRNK